MPSSSFYADGETYSTALVTAGDQPGTLTPSQAPSSFYPDGATYAQDNPDLSSKFADLAAASAAAALASQNAAKTSETNAASSAASAAAHDSSSQTQAQNAYANAQSAFSSASAASTSATAASTSATNAATSATNASGSATAASGSATAASGSATAASGSASAAATSAGNAHTSELNAATSASNASSAATTAAASAVQAVAGTATPLVNGTAAVGTSTKWAHEDHRHPTDTTRAPLDSPVFTTSAKAPTPANGDNSTNIATTAFVLANATGTGAVRYDVAQSLTDDQHTQIASNAGLPFGCGRLSYASATTLTFKPCNGDMIKIGGTVYRIPSAGVTLTNSGLAASTLYYVYLYSNAGVLTGELSTTGHGTSSATGNIGVETKNGDNTRTLIGMVFTNPGGSFQDGANFIGVLSWFNRKMKVANASIGNVATASTATVVLSGISVICCSWADEGVLVLTEGQANTSGAYAFIAAAADTASATVGAPQYCYNLTNFVPACVGGPAAMTEGAHSYVAVGGAASGSGTLTWNNVMVYVTTRG